MSDEDWEQRMAAVMDAAQIHNAADEVFVKEMIPHHEAAIAMVAALGSRGVSPEVKALAAGIKSAQEREITAMKALLASWGVQVPKSGGGGMHM